MELKLTLRLLTKRKAHLRPRRGRAFRAGPGAPLPALCRRVLEMAYSKAWRIVRAAEEGMGCKLLSSSTGGRHGGGASLTPEAERLLTAYRTLETEVNAYSQERFHALFDSL